jgi:signal peptidase
MWEGGPKAPFSGYITKGDHNDRIDQVAGGIIGMANISYIQQHQDQIIEVTPGSIYIDKKTGLIIYIMENKTLVVEGISYLTPVKKDWVIGVARVRIPIVGYVRLIPNIIGDEINKILGKG